MIVNGLPSPSSRFDCTSSPRNGHATNMKTNHEYHANKWRYKSSQRLPMLGLALVFLYTQIANVTYDSCFASATQTDIKYTKYNTFSITHAIRNHGSFLNNNGVFRKKQLQTELYTTTTKLQQESLESSNSHNILYPWEIIGIVLGFIFAIVLIVLILIQITCGIGTTLMFRRRPPIMFVRRRQTRRGDPNQSAANVVPNDERTVADVS